jgi:predicted unusual protein kinase regulating ubiquinone biosynthesis (AarF/ABC1/UbiB family)
MQVGAIDEVTKLKLKLSDLGCYSVIKMIFFDNLVHGDMHPGTDTLDGTYAA